MGVAVFVVVGVFASSVIDLRLHIDAPLAVDSRRSIVMVVMLDDALALDDARGGTFVSVVALAIDRSIEIC